MMEDKPERRPNECGDGEPANKAKSSEINECDRRRDSQSEQKG